MSMGTSENSVQKNDSGEVLTLPYPIIGILMLAGNNNLSATMDSIAWHVKNQMPATYYEYYIFCEPGFKENNLEKLLPLLENSNNCAIFLIGMEESMLVSDVRPI